MSKHTAGPWRAEYGNNNARVIAKVEHEVAAVPMLRSTNAEENGNRDVMVANARLISASPDLLAELKRAVAIIEEARVNGASQVVPESMRAAIAKATGGK